MHGNLHDVKFSLHGKQTGFSQSHFCRLPIPSFDGFHSSLLPQDYKRQLIILNVSSQILCHVAIISH